VAEINGLLNRRRALKLYRGFESLPHRWKREVAQAGSAPGLGPGGRRFESCLPDKMKPLLDNTSSEGFSFYH
jgi:hypothetical protein